MSSDFWCGRSVLVTGHTGFKGSWLCARLAAAGARLAGYALDPPTEPNMYELIQLGRQLEWDQRGDIADLPRLTETVRRFRPEMVVHMAAQPLVRQSYRQPVETFAVNVTGTANLLEAARQSGSVRAIVCVTSDKCYLNPDGAGAHTETDRLGGRDPYSASKACAELVCDAYRSSFFAPANHSAHVLSLATVRAGNVIGGGDWAADRIVPDLVRALAAGTPLALRHPQATRPWQHVLDPIEGYLALGRRLLEDGPEFGGAWNFGPAPGESVSVRHLAERFCASWGSPVILETPPGEQPYEAPVLTLDARKAADRLGWRPRLGLAEAVAMTAHWYRCWQSGGDLGAVTQQQIAAFHGLHTIHAALA